MRDSFQDIRQILHDEHLDALLISSSKNIAYLTDYFGFSDVERDAYLLVTKKNKYIFTNSLYQNEVEMQISDAMLLVSTSGNPFKDNLKKIYKDEKISTVGFEETDLRVSEFQKISFDGISYHPVDLHDIRKIKSNFEIEKLQNACELTDRAFDYITNFEIKPGLTEKQLANSLELFIKQNGADLSFPTIVAFGKNSSTPHHHTDDTRLKSNDIILIDFGVKLDNYCSDMTRTFFVGKPTTEQQKVYQTVYESQQKAVEFIANKLSSSSEVQRTKSRSNNEKIKQSNSSPRLTNARSNIKISAKDVDQIARDYIISKGYPSIPHSLGHGIGLEVHEAPSLSPFSGDMLEEGMIFSIEPGIYLSGGRQASQGFGVRIEDLYAIQGGKLIGLTQSNNSLTLVK